MTIPLKYRIPLLVFLIGLLLVLFEGLIQKNIEYSRMIENTSAQAKIIGNRIASSITLDSKTKGIVKESIVSLTAPYMTDSVNEVVILDQNLIEVFQRSIVSSEHQKYSIDKSLSKRVSQELFSHLIYVEDKQHILGYFPIELPAKPGKVISRNQGVLFLVFDVSVAHETAKRSIINTSLMNIAVVTLMIITFSSLIYFLVFRRLDILHEATKKMSQGDFSLEVKDDGADELSEVIETFNEMAQKMNAYKHDMELEVEAVVKERTEQAKILVQQSRMASMGEMIGNIAHQWRQPLNALSLIIQKVQIFSHRGKLTPEIVDSNAEKATLLISNMSKTIDDFRDFFKPDKQKEYFYLKDVVNDVNGLLEAGLKHMDVRVDIDIDQWCELYGFKNEFSQVIVNLFNNSKDAFKEHNVLKRKITLKGWYEDEKVILKVSDNAGGIPEEIISRIFEPYYTTKEEGKGTGIGLYMSKMIVEENMDGEIMVRNKGKGVEFSIVLKHHKRG